MRRKSSAARPYEHLGTLTYLRALSEACDRRVRPYVQLAAYIALHGGGEAAGCYVSQEVMAEALDCSDDQVGRGVKVLVERGWIAKLNRPNRTSILHIVHRKPAVKRSFEQGATEAAADLVPQMCGSEVLLDPANVQDDYSCSSTKNTQRELDDPERSSRQTYADDLTEYFTRWARHNPDEQEIAKFHAMVLQLLSDGYDMDLILVQLQKLVRSNDGDGRPYGGFAIDTFVRRARAAKVRKIDKVIETAYQQWLPRIEEAINYESSRGDPDGWAETLYDAAHEDAPGLLQSYYESHPFMGM